MNGSDIVQIIVIIVLIGLSAFFSSAETSFTMINKLKLRSMCAEGNKGAIRVAKILENPSRMLSSILVGNNIVNIGVSSLTTTFTINHFGGAATGISTAILTVILLIFGEITPKTLASKRAESIAIAYARAISIVIVLLTPVVFVINLLSSLILRIFRSKDNNPTGTITEAELRALVDVGHEEGVFNSEEKELIHNVFEFGDSLAKDIMVPRIDMISLDVESSFDEAVKTFKNCGHSRIPVYEGKASNIVGILHSKDMLLSDAFTDPCRKSGFHISDVMRPAYFTYETQNNDVLFKDMQKNSSSSAIVLDEFGGLAGFITTQDLVEEITGAIRDEHDDPDDVPLMELGEGLYRVEGSYKLDELNDELGCNLESEDNDSVGGLITEILERFPRPGDTVETGGVRFTVLSLDDKRVEYVYAKLLDQEGDGRRDLDDKDRIVTNDSWNEGGSRD